MKIYHLVLKLLAKLKIKKIWNVINTSNRHYQTREYTFIILKISQLVLKLLAKNRFSAAILNFYDHTGRRIFEPILFYWSLLSNLKICHYNLENISISSQISAKDRFSAAILNFYDHTGSRIFEPIYFTNHYHRNWKFAIKILKISQLVLKFLAKNRFLRTFWIFTTKPEVECSNLFFY